ncbi:MAG: restriction endonuclease subunit S [Candidatus Latescibacterota bacterium]
MKKGWDRSTIGNYCEVIAGQSPQGKFYNGDGEGMPFYQGKKDFGDRFIKAPTTWTTETTKTARKDDILMSVRAPVGPVNFATEDICIGRGLAAIRSRGQLDVDFLFYQLLHLQPEIAGKEGAVFASINKSEIVALPIAVGPLPEQQRIVGILDEAFAGLATAKANAEKNLQNARALFESHLNAVFSRRGEGWVEKKLGDICGFVRGPFGGSLKKSIFVADGYAIYEQKHAIYDQFDEVRYFIDEAKFKEMKRFELRPNDLIMSCSGTMGRVAIVPVGIKRGIINQALLKLTPTANISKAFLKFWMESEAFQDALKEYSGGAAIQNVASVKVLKEIRIPLPSLVEQARIVESIKSFSTETQRLESFYQRKLAALEELKKSLLHQAFAGEL